MPIGIPMLKGRRMSILDDHRTEKELAEQLKARTGIGCVRTLRKWREQRIGPPWAKIGRVILYPNDDFEAWLKTLVQQPVRSRRGS
jgi:hypothetical protein